MEDNWVQAWPKRALPIKKRREVWITKSIENETLAVGKLLGNLDRVCGSEVTGIPTSAIGNKLIEANSKLIDLARQWEEQTRSLPCLPYLPFLASFLKISEPTWANKPKWLERYLNLIMMNQRDWHQNNLQFKVRINREDPKLPSMFLIATIPATVTPTTDVACHASQPCSVCTSYKRNQH